MTDEDAFHAALDTNPADHAIRLVFADWLDERCDPRGPGYRALGTVRVYSETITDASDGSKPRCQFTHRGNATIYKEPNKRNRWHCCLPMKWFRKIPVEGSVFEPDHKQVIALMKEMWRNRPTRRDMEDAAALAFGRLSPAQQSAILADAPAT